MDADDTRAGRRTGRLAAKTVALTFLLLTVGLAGCLDDGSSGSGAAADACPERGDEDPRLREDVEEDTTWSPDPARRADYVIDRGFTIGNRDGDRIRLTVEPCTIVEAKEDTELSVSGKGELYIQGGSGEPVIFRAANGQPGGWEGITVVLRDGTDVRIEHATILHGGGPKRDADNLAKFNRVANDDGGLEIVPPDYESPGERLDVVIRDVTVAESATNGLVLSAWDVSDQITVERVTLEDNAFYGGAAEVNSLGLLTGAEFEGNGAGAVEVFGGFVAEGDEVVWPDIDGRVDVTQGLTPGDGRLVFPAGTKVHFRELGDLRVGSRHPGQLVVNGTATDPVWFLPSPMENGSWAGIDLNFRGNHGDHELRHLFIRGAGDKVHENPALFLRFVDNDMSLLLDNVTIANNEGPGMTMHANTTFDPTRPMPGFVMRHVQFTGNGGPSVVLPLNAVQYLDAKTSSYFPSDTYEIHAIPRGSYHNTGDGGILVGEQTWGGFDGVVRISDPGKDPSPELRTLTIRGRWILEPGAKIASDPGMTLFVAGGGDHPDPGLTAIGTAEEPIRFMGSNASGGGAWDDIGFHGPDTTSTLDHVIVQGGGQGRALGSFTNTWNLDIDPAKVGPTYHVTIRNSTIRDSTGQGLYLGDTDLRGHVTLKNNTYDGNAEYPIVANTVNLAVLDGSARFSSNGENRVLVPDGGWPSEIEGTRRIAPPALEVPYLLETGWWLDDDTVVLEAGTRIEVAEDHGFSVGEATSVGSGTLIAEGTQEDPIHILGEIKTAGSWRGLLFNTKTTDNRLEWVHLRHGGSSEALVGYGGPCYYVKCDSTTGIDGDRGNLVIIDGKVTWTAGTSAASHSDGRGIWIDECWMLEVGPDAQWAKLDNPKSLGGCHPQATL